MVHNEYILQHYPYRLEMTTNHFLLTVGKVEPGTNVLTYYRQYLVYNEYVLYVTHSVNECLSFFIGGGGGCRGGLSGVRMC